MFGIELLILIRAVTYLAIGIIAVSRRSYSITALMFCLTGAAFRPEVILNTHFNEALLVCLPATALWVGWDLLHKKQCY